MNFLVFIISVINLYSTDIKKTFKCYQFSFGYYADVNIIILRGIV